MIKETLELPNTIKIINGEVFADTCIGNVVIPKLKSEEFISSGFAFYQSNIDYLSIYGIVESDNFKSLFRGAKIGHLCLPKHSFKERLLEYIKGSYYSNLFKDCSISKIEHIL